MTWSHTKSDTFLTFRKAFIPQRERIVESVIQFIRHTRDETFTFADICPGDGWLTKAILSHFPKAKAIALDRTDMLQRMLKPAIASFERRVTYQDFDLKAETWTKQLTPVSYYVSSFSLYEIDDAYKRTFLKQLYRSLQPDGGVMFLEMIAPTDEAELVQFADELDAIVREQSMLYFGSEEAYDYYANNEWNMYRDPHTTFQPLSVAKYLRLLNDVGFNTVMVTPLAAGHVLFSGWK